VSTLKAMARPKPHYHHGDLRNALVEQALRLVEEAGAESFSLREAARLVGVSANAAYRHFADKSDLLLAVAAAGAHLQQQYLLRALSAVPERSTAAGAAIERLKAVGRGYVDFAVAHPELLRVMFGSRWPAPRNADGFRTTGPYALLGKTLDDLVSAGVLPAGRRPGAELKAWTVVHGFATLVIQGVAALQNKPPRNKAFEALFDFALIGLCGRMK
jgi:AcrR family transcriptional regulator